MDDLKRVSIISIILIVILRLSIGWQFLYEGMWKYNSMSSANPWTAEGYLKNAQGPFRDHFRSMVGDPDDVNLLNYYQVSKSWYDWRNQFINHYGLNDDQQAKLNQLIDGTNISGTDPAVVPPTPVPRQKLDQLPPKVNLDKYKDIIRFEADKKELVVLLPITPSEEADLAKMVNVERVVAGGETKYLTRGENPQPADSVEADYFKALSRLIELSRKFAYRHKLAAMLKGDPENVGVVWRLEEGEKSHEFEMGTVKASEENDLQNNIRYGKIQEYLDLLDEYETALTKAKISYQYEHAQKLSIKLAILKAQVVNPVKALDIEFKQAAKSLLTAEQLAKGPPPQADTPLYQADQQAMWGLLIIGVCLLLGFFTRGAAVAGAVMLLMFYLVVPPWPGVPPAPGPEHSFIVNKNLIESFALLCIAALPTGTWFGVDAIFSGFWRRKD